jgi:hypothetical protein
LQRSRAKIAPPSAWSHAPSASRLSLKTARIVRSA